MNSTKNDYQKFLVSLSCRKRFLTFDDCYPVSVKKSLFFVFLSVKSLNLNILTDNLAKYRNGIKFVNSLLKTQSKNKSYREVNSK